MRRIFEWEISEKIAFEVLAQICRARGALFGFDLIDSAVVEHGPWITREKWKHNRKVSCTITFEKRVWPLDQQVLRVIIKLEGIKNTDFPKVRLCWHPTEVHYSCGSEKATYVYRDPAAEKNNLQSFANWEYLYEVLKDGKFRHISSGRLMNAR